MIRLYFDDDSQERPVLDGLRRSGIDIQIPRDVGLDGQADAVHLRHATEADRVVVTRNQGDFVRLHGETIRSGGMHAGIAIAPARLTIGQRVRALQAMNAELDSVSMANRLEFLTDWVDR